MTLMRFREAQTGKMVGLPSFDLAFKEIQAGQKKSHWIWYILPQLKSLGYSAQAKKYGLEHFQEACDYLQDPILFANYQKLIQEISQQLQRTSITHLMGSKTDAKKLVSSLTLFKEASQILGLSIYKVCDEILRKANNEGLAAPCLETLNAIQKTNHEKTRSSHRVVHNHAALTAALDKYIKTRKNEWRFHYNFLGIIALIYFIQDTLYGTHYFNSKNRETKIQAAEKLKHQLNSGKNDMSVFTASEKEALQEGRLGELIKCHGGLKPISKQNQSQTKDNPMRFN